MTTKTNRIPPIHPGEILKTEFLDPLGITEYRLAKEIHVPPIRINDIVHGKRGVSVDTALRLSRYFGLNDTFWLTIQSRYDVETESQRLAAKLDEIHPMPVDA